MSGWIAIGFAIYFGYGIRHSRLNVRYPPAGKVATGKLPD
jgi:hypothetical protein